MKKTIIYSTPDNMDVFEQYDYQKSIHNVTDKQKFELEMYSNSNINTPKDGTVTPVTYVGKNDDYFMFDGNFKDYVRVENKAQELKYLKNTNIGDVVDVLITKVQQNNFFIKGSLAELYETKAHATLKSIDEDSPVSCFVREMTPAGYNVDILHEGVTLQGFMPNTLSGINRLRVPESIVGKTFDVMIESFSKDEGTYIVSRKKFLQSLIPQEIKKLVYGDVYTGHVTGTTEFGVFVEFNEYLTGMIHKTNIDPDWQNRLKEIQPGFEIQFYVKEVVKDKIILTQILRETLWDTIKIGQTLNGQVKDIKQFGALVSLDEETLGLIHTSEMEKSSKKIQIGDNIKIKIIAIDRMNRKIFLSV